MPDDLYRLWEQQKAFQLMAEPSHKLQQHFNTKTNITSQLEFRSKIINSIYGESERKKILPSLTIEDACKSIFKDNNLKKKSIEETVRDAAQFELINSKFDTQKSINSAATSRQYNESFFRLPNTSELGSIAHEVMEKAHFVRSVLGNGNQLQSAMASMHSPWLQIESASTSAQALSEIFALGRGIDILQPFDKEFTKSLRRSLGDWRNTQIPPPELLLDPLLRSSFYVKQGFDLSLTDFTPQAFDEGLRIAGLLNQELTESDESEDESDESEKEGFQRSKEAFAELQSFEIALRRFIQREMQSAFGDKWMKQNICNIMFDAWKSKQAKAKSSGYTEQPLINFADFSDYIKIIERRDNWNRVFKHVFTRKEDVSESFQRLFPVRIATMHARIITREDQLMLLLETKRVLKAIQGNRASVDKST